MWPDVKDKEKCHAKDEVNRIKKRHETNLNYLQLLLRYLFKRKTLIHLHGGDGITCRYVRFVPFPDTEHAYNCPRQKLSVTKDLTRHPGHSRVPVRPVSATPCSCALFWTYGC